MGAKYVGIFQSLIVTCKMHGIDPYTYLVDVLQRVADHPKSEIEKLTPGRANYSPPEKGETTAEPADSKSVSGRLTWQELMKRSFDVDVLKCPKCSSGMRLISVIKDPKVVLKILDHLGLPSSLPTPEPPRPPPEQKEFEFYADA